jgi:Icc-related predicted phosphoesterase
VVRLRRAPGSETRIFFASDLHGSEAAFRKFLRAASFYGAEALVFGGDLMGKALVPVVRDGGGWRARFLGEDQAFDDDGLRAFARRVEATGLYWRAMDREEYEALRADPLLLGALFRDLAAQRLAAWLAVAEERLAGTGVRMYLTGGNDDEPAVLAVLDAHRGDHVVACEGKVVDLDGRHTMITVGWSTPTPWGTPREASEEDIARAIEVSVARVPDPGRCLFNVHVPPADSPLDQCVRVEPPSAPGELPRPVRVNGRPVLTHVGSRAVREAILAYQPLAGLHGHVHESPGRVRLGRTECFNPGSEYGQGLLLGVILTLRDGRVVGYQHTSG